MVEARNIFLVRDAWFLSLSAALAIINHPSIPDSSEQLFGQKAFAPSSSVSQSHAPAGRGGTNDYILISGRLTEGEGRAGEEKELASAR